MIYLFNVERLFVGGEAFLGVRKGVEGGRFYDFYLLCENGGFVKLGVNWRFVRGCGVGMGWDVEIREL